jgi:glycogen debranching enzyme
MNEGFNKRLNAQAQSVAPIESNVIANSFSVQVSRITTRDLTYLKIKGAFKIKVKNKGDVGITIFENFQLPSYAEEVFETGESNLSFVNDTKIQYDDISTGENIDIHLTAYFKLK